MAVERLTYTVEEAAVVLGLGRTLAWEMIRSGELPHLRVGRRVLVPRKDLDAEAMRRAVRSADRLAEEALEEQQREQRKARRSSEKRQRDAVKRHGGYGGFGPCALCGREVERVVDHDHRCCPRHKSCSQCRRGLLCGMCNSGLGQLGDTVEGLERALEYLRNPPGVPWDSQDAEDSGICA